MVRVQAYLPNELYEKAKRFSDDFPETVGFSAWVRHVIAGKVRQLEKDRARKEEAMQRRGKGYWPSGWPKELKANCCQDSRSHDPDNHCATNPGLLRQFWYIRCFKLEDDEYRLDVRKDLYVRGARKLNEKNAHLWESPIEEDPEEVLERKNRAQREWLEEIEQRRSVEASEITTGEDLTEEFYDGGEQ